MNRTCTPRLCLPFLLAVMLLLVSTPGCCGAIVVAPPPAAPCKIETLLVSTTVFPEGWEQIGSGVPSAAFGIERLGITFSTRIHGVAAYDVYRAVDTRTATVGYRDFMSYFSSNQRNTEWGVPSELADYSSVAEQFRIGCSIAYPGGVEHCQFVGRYNVYVVIFHAYMSSEQMTYQDFERILKDIDSRMTKCLRSR